MAEDKAIWFPWYPKDCDTDETIRSMTNEELGFYVRCLNHAWVNNGLPVGAIRIARLFRISPEDFARLWEAIGPCFEERDGRLVNPRQERERVKSQALVDQRRAAIKARWDRQKIRTEVHGDTSERTSVDTPVNNQQEEIREPYARISGVIPTQHNTTQVVSTRVEVSTSLDRKCGNEPPDWGEIPLPPEPDVARSVVPKRQSPASAGEEGFTLSSEQHNEYGSRWFNRNFEDWYQFYWCKTAKEKARVSYQTRINKLRKDQKMTHEDAAKFLIEQVAKDRNANESEECWTWRSKMHPATWLNGQRWQDQPAAPVNNGHNGRPRFGPPPAPPKRSLTEDEIFRKV